VDNGNPRQSTDYCYGSERSEGLGLEKGICKFLKLLDQSALEMAKGLSGLLSGDTLAIISLRSFMTFHLPHFSFFKA
jgi:hypothetical protein